MAQHYSQDSGYAEAKGEITAARASRLFWGLAFVGAAIGASVVLTAATTMWPIIAGAVLAAVALGCLVGVFNSTTNRDAKYTEIGAKRTVQLAQQQGVELSNEKGTDWQQKVSAERAQAFPGKSV